MIKYMRQRDPYSTSAESQEKSAQFNAEGFQEYELDSFRVWRGRSRDRETLRTISNEMEQERRRYRSLQSLNFQVREEEELENPITKEVLKEDAVDESPLLKQMNAANWNSLLSTVQVARVFHPSEFCKRSLRV